MIKLIGACMALAACGGMGLTWARNYQNRPRQLSALQQSLQLLETEIIYGATPLPEAMELVAARSNRESAGLFQLTAAEFRKMDGVTAGEAWDKAVKMFYPDSALSDTDLQVLKRFGVTLGASDKEDQAKHLQLTMNQLKMAAAEAETDARKHSTVYRYLGFLGGLFLVLIIY